MSDTRVSPALERLAGCVRDTLKAEAIKVCGTFLTTGQGIAIDQPPGESMAWVRLVTIVPGNGQGGIATGSQCAQQWTVDIEVGIAHCWPLQEDPLTVDQHLAAAVQVNDSMMALYKAIACCDWQQKKNALSVTRWQPIGPQGGIVGGAWLFQIVV